MKKDLGQGPEEYLQLYVETRSLKIMVPADAVQAAGIRDLSTKKEAGQLLATLEEPSEVPEGWAERNVSTVARLKSHDLDQMSMVVRDLIRHQRRAGKPLTLREKDIFESSLDIVARELSLVLEMSKEDTKKLIVEKCLNGSDLND